MSRGSAKVIIALLSIGMMVLGTMIYRLYGRINDLEISISSFSNALSPIQGLYTVNPALGIIGVSPRIVETQRLKNLPLCLR